MKIDPYQHQESWVRWKKKIHELGFIPEISRANSSIILRYLNDMELGINTSLSSSKGARSFTRLRTLKSRLIFLAKKFEEHFSLDDITAITEEQVCSFFTGMRNGKLIRQDGAKYRATKDFVKNFKSFWHWHQKVAKKGGKTVEDITQYLDTSGEKPEWVYMNEEQIRQFSDNCKPHYKALVLFLFDSGVRAPTELMNIKVSDFSPNYKEVTIRDEVSKTFGRRIKLMICPEIMKRYVKDEKLQSEDYLFTLKPHNINKYLKRLAKKLFGEEKSQAGQKYSELSMYDFRHNSCCYWLPRYKSESALKYRFGWKKSDKIHYYSEMLGMRDTITEEDLLVDVTKTELEKRLVHAEKRADLFEGQVEVMKNQMVRIYDEVTNLKTQVELLGGITCNQS